VVPVFFFLSISPPPVVFFFFFFRGGGVFYPTNPPGVFFIFGVFFFLSPLSTFPLKNNGCGNGCWGLGGVFLGVPPRGWGGFFKLPFLEKFFFLFLKPTRFVVGGKGGVNPHFLFFWLGEKNKLFFSRVCPPCLGLCLS